MTWVRVRLKKDADIAAMNVELHRYFRSLSIQNFLKCRFYQEEEDLSWVSRYYDKEDPQFDEFPLLLDPPKGPQTWFERLTQGKKAVKEVGVSNFKAKEVRGFSKSQYLGFLRENSHYFDSIEGLDGWINADDLDGGFGVMLSLDPGMKKHTKKLPEKDQEPVRITPITALRCRRWLVSAYKCTESDRPSYKKRRVYANPLMNPIHVDHHGRRVVLVPDLDKADIDEVTVRRVWTQMIALCQLDESFELFAAKIYGLKLEISQSKGISMKDAFLLLRFVSEKAQTIIPGFNPIDIVIRGRLYSGAPKNVRFRGVEVEPGTPAAESIEKMRSWIDIAAAAFYRHGRGMDDVRNVIMGKRKIFIG